MAFFGKNNKKDDDYEEEYEDERRFEKKGNYRQKTIKNKDLKDLNPKDKRKRKEPAKPWGRRERLFILSLLILTAGISGYLALSARNFKLPGIPRISFSANFISNFFKGKTYVLEGDKNQNSVSGAVEKDVSGEVSNLSGVYGVYGVDLENGSNFGLNEDEVFQAASLIKLPLMAAMYQKAESGEMDLDSKYTLKESDKISGAGSLYSKPAGYEITYRNLIRLMGKQSDNTAFNICRKLIGDDVIDETAVSIGMSATNVENNETTPRDIGTFFEELWNDNIVAKDDADELLEYLTDTSFESWIPQGIPSGIRVAHKVGLETHVINDAGIVYADRPFVLVVLSKGIVEKEANNVLPEISGRVYDRLEKGQN